MTETKINTSVHLILAKIILLVSMVTLMLIETDTWSTRLILFSYFVTIYHRCLKFKVDKCKQCSHLNCFWNRSVQFRHKKWKAFITTFRTLLKMLSTVSSCLLSNKNKSYTRDNFINENKIVITKFFSLPEKPCLPEVRKGDYSERSWLSKDLTTNQANHGRVYKW